MIKQNVSEAAGPPIDLSKASHLRAWQDIANSSPQRIALISNHQQKSQLSWLHNGQTDVECAQLTFGDLDRAARRLATTLNRLVPVQRRSIAVLLDNQAEWLLCFLAAAYLHSPLVPLNPKTASRPEEIRHMLSIVQPAVLIASDDLIVAELDRHLDYDILEQDLLKIAIAPTGSTTPGGWLSLADVTGGELTPPDTPTMADPQETAVILFTSGTTSLPKPCAITSAQTVNAALAYQQPRSIKPDSRFIAHLPNFHSYGIGWMLAFLLSGASIVLPAKTFEAKASLHCIEKFGATHMSLVPTTAQAMTAHPDLRTTNVSSLVSLDIAGAGVLLSVVEACEKAFHVPVGTSYGMTESPTTLIWPIDASRVILDGQVMSGQPSQGARVKICHPGTRDVVPIGTAGELHTGGVQVIESYYDCSSDSSAFYRDTVDRIWLQTGDQAVMYENGKVRICGRYKDLIIRGGENISPASIEACLQKANGVRMVQVVGIADELAGEVPIAVIQTEDSATVNRHMLKTLASTTLGPAFAPKLILDLKTDLSLDEYPTTAAGKIRKVELAVLVDTFLQSILSSTPTGIKSTLQSLLSIWKRISGNDELLPSTTVQSFADSLMMMQLSALVKRELRKDVVVEDFKACVTIQEQADLIDTVSEHATAPSRPVKSGPPAARDLVFLSEGQTTFQDTKTSVFSALAKHNLEWHDVEDISPLPDWDAIFTTASRPQSWNLRWSYHCRATSIELESALRKILPYHQVLRCVAIQSTHELPLLVTLRANQAWYNAAWTNGHVLENKAELDTLLLDDPVLDSACLGGPMFRVHVASLQDGTSGLVVVASHAVCDMSMTKLWLDDLAAIMSGQAIVPHISFHDYATASYAHRDGPSAAAGVTYWTEKLQGIGSLPESVFWPPQRAPEFFKGNDAGWRHFNGTKARASERNIDLAEKRMAQIGIKRVVQVSSISSLKSAHNVPIFMLVKAAIALMNIKLTGAREAVFGTLNAARKWPFADDYTAAERRCYAGNALDISGCTTEYVLDRVSINSEESVAQFMQRVTAEEEQNSAHVKTPILRVIDALRQPLTSTDTRSWLSRERDAEAVLTCIRRQSFNWLPTAPSAQDSEEGLRLLQLLTRMDNGLTITGFLAEDKCSVILSFAWDAEHLTKAEAEEALSLLARLVSLMGEERNWNKGITQLMDQ